jgi:Ca2+/H+ antiporter, TMEM165/GDT1 family
MTSILPPSDVTLTDLEQESADTTATTDLGNELGNELGNIETTAASAAACDKPNFWGCFLSTFVTIFLAEIGDKTQVTTLLLSAQSHAPWLVFLGAASALIATSLVGVLLGQWLARRVSPRTLDTLAAILLIFITIGLVADVMAA